MNTGNKNMEDVNLVHDKESDIYQKILFERPISRLQSRSIGLLAGKHTRLKKINDIHEIILAMNHNTVIIAESELKTAGVPAEVYLEPGKKISNPYANSDEAIEALQDCSYVTVGMDIEIGSRLQIFLEKLISTRQAPIVFTSESISLFKISPHLVSNRKDDMYICNTKSLIQLADYLGVVVTFKPNAGIYNKIGLLKILAQHLQAHIVCIENYQILSCSYTDTTKATITNIHNNADISLDYYFLAILLSLLCDVSNPNTDILDRVLTSGYLLRNSLDAKHNFIQNLKQALLQ